MNERDGQAAAAFYTQDGVLVETDLSPHLVTRGRDALAARFNDLYDMGLRLAPAGAPISYDRYVAEPVRFFNGNAPGRGAGMLVFESGAGGKFARQWMLGWVGGPQKTFTLLASPSPERPNLPPAEVMRVLEGRLAAVNRGDGAAAAALYTEHGVVEQLGSAGSDVGTGRDEIAALVKSLHDTGLRMEPAGAPITYDCYVAEPVRFSSASGLGSGAAMLVFAFAPSHKIKHEYMIGWVGGDGPASPSSSAW